MNGLVVAEFGLLILFPFLMAYAAASDLLTMLIPNRITLALILGFVLLAASGLLTPGEIGLHVGAAFIVLAATFTLFALNVIGGGDAKLAAATTLWLGFDGLLDYLLVASIFGGALTLAILLARSHPLPGRLARLPSPCTCMTRRRAFPTGSPSLPPPSSCCRRPRSGRW